MFISRNKVPNNIFSRLGNLFHLLFTNIWRLTRTSIYTTRFHSIWNDIVFKTMNLTFIQKFVLYKKWLWLHFDYNQLFVSGNNPLYYYVIRRGLIRRIIFYASLEFDISIVSCFHYLEKKNWSLVKQIFSFVLLKEIFPVA